MLSQASDCSRVAAVAVVFVLRGRAWFSWVTGLIVSHSRRGQVVQFVLSLPGVIPLLGLMAFVTAHRFWHARQTVVGDQKSYRNGTGRYCTGLPGRFCFRPNAPMTHILWACHPSNLALHRRFILLGYAMMAFGLAQVLCDSQRLMWCRRWLRCSRSDGDGDKRCTGWAISPGITIVDTDDVQRSVRVTCCDLRSVVA
jgi:hypothetical protein